MRALRRIGTGPLGHLRLRPDRGNRGAQLMGGVGREAALRGHHPLDALEQAIERLHHRPHLCRHVGQRDGLQALRLALFQRLTELAQRGKPLAHRPPARQGQQWQGNNEGQQHVAQDGPKNRTARRRLFADINLHIALGAARRKHAPLGTIGQAHGLEPLRLI